MISRLSGIHLKLRNTVSIKRSVVALAGMVALGALCASMQADAQPARFRYVGGRWSHARHAGWHRYWGGPSIGFYYAPSPVYIVPGYAAPSYYYGPDFWYSDPSFGLSINLGGGGYYRRGHYYGGYGRRWHDNGHFDRDRRRR
jgi:hypothetical protein